jgi:hypothetical protein
MAMKSYRGKLREGKIEWIGKVPTEEGEVCVVVRGKKVRPKQGKSTFLKFGMFGPPVDNGMSVEDEIAFIKSLAEPKDDVDE